VSGSYLPDRDILSTLALIRQSIVIMLFTLPGERVIWPEFGGGLRRPGSDA
jgi:phage baseplate assembly protein W